MNTRIRIACFLAAAALMVGACVPLEVGVETPTTTQPAPATNTSAPAEPSATTAPAEPSATTAPAEPTATQPAAPTTEAPASPTEPTPTETAAPATPTESMPPTGTPPADVTDDVILILAPGPLSAVTSPVSVSGEADPTFEQNLVIQITDENNNVLTTTPTTIMADLGQRGPFAADVTFSVASEQPGRISVYSASARDGGLVHLASIEVTLRPSGAADIRPAGPRHESIFIRQPAHLEEISGGTLTVTGWSNYVFESSLGLMLCGEGGSGAAHDLCGTDDNILAQGFAIIDSPDIGYPGPLEGSLTYTVTAPTRARVVVYDTSARDGGLLHVSTVEVTLNP